MRLRRLGLDSYGNFAAQQVELDAAPGRINLIVAPNGAGKSVLRHAMSELLFGIHQQSPMGFQFDYGRMRLRADAVFPDGETIGFIRRKGRTNTLTDPAGNAPHPSLPSRLPRDSERKRLERLFVLDSAQLRAGGRALLQTDGDLADALLSSAGDLGSARTLAADLAARRDAAAPVRRSASTPFYKACDDWAAAGVRLAETVVRPPTVAEHERDRADAMAAREAAVAAEADAREALARLNRVRSTRRHLDALDEAGTWLAGHRDAPVLLADAGLALRAARAAQADAGREEQAAREQHAALAAALESAAVDTAVLEEAAAIERLTAARGQSEQSHADVPKRQAELLEAERAIARLLLELSSARDPAEAASEVRAAADIAAARDLIAAAGDISLARKSAADAVERHRKAIAEAEDELAGLPPALATEALRAMLDEVMADGDPARLARQAQDAVAGAAAREAAAGARAGASCGLPVPTDPALARLDKTLGTAQAAAGAAEERRAEAEASLDAARERLAELTGARPLPDEAALLAARAHRDRGWALVFARLTGAADAAGEVEYASATPLPLAFAKAMAAADEVADRRAAEMERLATAVELRAAVGRAAATLAATAERAGLARAVAEGASAAWAEAVAPLGLSPAAGLAEARAVLAGREAALEAVEAHRNAAHTAAMLAERQAGWAERLAALLDTAPDTLPRLVNAARSRSTKAERDAAQRQTFSRALAVARRAAAEAVLELETAEAGMAAWAARWDAVLGRLRCPPGEMPGAVAAMLDRLVELPAKVEAAETARVRLADMGKQLGDFAAACAQAGRRLGEPDGDPAALARRLAARLDAARKASGARDALARQAALALGRKHCATESLAAAARHLEAAVRATGADTVDDAERRVVLAAERTAHEDARAAAELRLREDGEGLDPEGLRAEAAAVPADSMGEAMRAAEEAARVASAAAQDAAARIERAEGALRTLAAGQDATRAATDRQAAAARAARVLEDALVQHLAAAMLDHALQQVEASSSANQRLGRIGATFATLTGGAYNRLSPAEEDGESKEHGRLIAHESGGGEKHIARLSEGTRDQLYLALRLVAVEDHVRGAPPLPFVADDVLQTFDDTRARAAMEALVELSRHVQVIVLTHHPHLLGVADGLPVHSVEL